MSTYPLTAVRLSFSFPTPCPCLLFCLFTPCYVEIHCGVTGPGSEGGWGLVLCGEADLAPQLLPRSLCLCVGQGGGACHARGGSGWKDGGAAVRDGKTSADGQVTLVVIDASISWLITAVGVVVVVVVVLTWYSSTPERLDSVL